MKNIYHITLAIIIGLHFMTDVTHINDALGIGPLRIFIFAVLVFATLVIRLSPHFYPSRFQNKYDLAIRRLDKGFLALSSIGLICCTIQINEFFQTLLNIFVVVTEIYMLHIITDAYSLAITLRNKQNVLSN